MYTTKIYEGTFEGTTLISQFENPNGYRSFALRASQIFWHQHPGIARMYFARVDVKPINRRRRSVESVHASRFKAGRDFTWTR